MSTTRALVRVAAPLATLVVVVVYGVIAFYTRDYLGELEWLRDLPPADPHAPSPTPALHAGRLRGPPGRATLAGQPAAAFWWHVADIGDEGAQEVKCSGRERSLLSLETAGGTLRLAFTEAEVDAVGLVTDTKNDELNRPVAIDLGAAPRTTHPLPPGTCAGERYQQSVLEDGASVEVMGCAQGGAIERCPPPFASSPGAILARELLDYRRHRAAYVEHLFLYALVIGASAIFVAALGVILHLDERLGHKRQLVWLGLLAVLLIGAAVAIPRHVTARAGLDPSSSAGLGR